MNIGYGYGKSRHDTRYTSVLDFEYTEKLKLNELSYKMKPIFPYSNYRLVPKKKMNHDKYIFNLQSSKIRMVGTLSRTYI